MTVTSPEQLVGTGSAAIALHSWGSQLSLQQVRAPSAGVCPPAGRTCWR